MTPFQKLAKQTIELRGIRATAKRMYEKAHAAGTPDFSAMATFDRASAAVLLREIQAHAAELMKAAAGLASELEADEQADAEADWERRTETTNR